MLNAVANLIEYQPNWLYQLKPLLFIVAGIVTFSLSTLSSVLFFAAAAVIFMKRRRLW